jgi:hypothetical protein
MGTAEASDWDSIQFQKKFFRQNHICMSPVGGCQNGAAESLIAQLDSQSTSKLL